MRIKLALHTSPHPWQNPCTVLLPVTRQKPIPFALLEGRYSLPDLLDPATAAFLSHCRFHKDYSPVHLADDHVYFWSRNPEDKGSKPHGLHNGHFKAAIQSPVLAYCDALFRNIPLTPGFVPSIEKKAGDFRLSKMRTIQLMNSEAQANNKKAGRAAMRYAETHSLIPDEIGRASCRERVFDRV